jgi:hypothetical protein
MGRNLGHIALAYLKHWLLKEDRYSQQSPFIFSVYQGAIDLLKKEKPSSKAEKIALLAAYFCQLTPAIQALEWGVGNETITKFLNQVTQGKLLKIQVSESLEEAKEVVFRQIQEQQSFDFVLIHPKSSQEYLEEALSLFLPRMHAQGILFLEGIHHSQRMHAYWKRVQADTEIQLTLDFLDFGVAFKSYTGPKTNLSLSY